jgi:hypothetical protein
VNHCNLICLLVTSYEHKRLVTISYTYYIIISAWIDVLNGRVEVPPGSCFFSFSTHFSVILLDTMI